MPCGCRGEFVQNVPPGVLHQPGKQRSALWGVSIGPLKVPRERQAAGGLNPVLVSTRNPGPLGEREQQEVGQARWCRRIPGTECPVQLEQLLLGWRLRTR